MKNIIIINYIKYTTNEIKFYVFLNICYMFKCYM